MVVWVIIFLNVLFASLISWNSAYIMLPNFYWIVVTFAAVGVAIKIFKLSHDASIQLDNRLLEMSLGSSSLLGVALIILTSLGISAPSDLGLIFIVTYLSLVTIMSSVALFVSMKKPTL
jgi:hypothetical protein